MSTIQAEPTSPPASPRMGRGPYWLAGLLAPLLVGPPLVLLAKALGWPVPLNTFAGAVVVLLLVTSSITDLHGRKIYNWATYPAFLYGVGINTVASVIDPPEWLGAVGLSSSLLAATGCFILLGVLASGTGGGSGDVKLATALGALLGVERVVTALLMTYALAGILVLIYLIVRYGPGPIFGTFFRRLIGFFLPRWVNPPDPNQEAFLKLRLPLAPFFALGTFTALIFVRPA